MSFANSSWRAGDASAGYFFAVFGAALFTAIAAFVLAMVDHAPRFDAATLALISVYVLVASAMVIGLAAGFIGLPLTWLLERYRLERLWTYPVAGLVIGAALVTFTPALTGDLRTGSALEFLGYSWIGGLPGCVCGAIWWQAHRRHLQDIGGQGG